MRNYTRVYNQWLRLMCFMKKTWGEKTRGTVQKLNTSVIFLSSLLEILFEPMHTVHYNSPLILIVMYEPSQISFIWGTCDLSDFLLFLTWMRPRWSVFDSPEPCSASLSQMRVEVRLTVYTWPCQENHQSATLGLYLLEAGGELFWLFELCIDRGSSTFKFD